MLIKIWVEDVTPFAGRIELDGRKLLPFSGWLELLSILSAYVSRRDGAIRAGAAEGAAEESPTSDRDIGHVDR